jgi:hypothetical protein
MEMAEGAPPFSRAGRFLAVAGFRPAERLLPTSKKCYNPTAIENKFWLAPALVGAGPGDRKSNALSS